MGSKKRKRLASTRAALIEAAIGGHYRFDAVEEAYTRLRQLRQQFTCAREQEDEFSLLLWIRGYEVSDAEAEKGYYGHYALIRPEALGTGDYTLKASKIDKPLANHPDKRRPQRSLPDWGHPVLRSSREGKTYATVEAAQKAMDRLQKDYPNVTIPGARKLNLMIYEKQEGGGDPVQKYVLTIVPEEGRHKIEAKKQHKPLQGTGEPKPEPEGKFTEMVARKKRR